MDYIFGWYVLLDPVAQAVAAVAVADGIGYWIWGVLIP